MMGWLRQQREPRDATGSTANERDPTLGELDGELDGELSCVTCTRTLDGDPDEDPTGNDGLPICGGCARERDFFDVEVVERDLDGRFD